MPGHPPDRSQPFNRFRRNFFPVNNAGSCPARALGCADPSRRILVPCWPTVVKLWQSTPSIWSNQRPNGRLWATLPVGLTCGNGSHLWELPTTPYAGGPSFVDACTRIVSERSLRSVWSASYTAYQVKRRHCRPVSLTHHRRRSVVDLLSCFRT